MKKRTVALALFLAAASIAPLWSAAQTADAKGFVFANGAAPKLHAEPKDGAKDVAAPPVGTRLLYRKVVKSGDAISWYFVDQPGVGAGWLAAADSAATRPSAPPPMKPIARVTPPDASPSATPGAPVAAVRSSQTSAGRTFSKSKLARGLSSRTLDARGLKSAEDADQIVQAALIDYTTLERRVGIQMSDPPHPTGQYANLTARGRKADAEAFAKTVQEGD